ncbi:MULTISPECIES: hypothetical protein [unclassified Novosphingobium]|uniref:cupin domain-containing protein n=1 Tax=unclassified Novosphingobium TaxID=2644732 RepID=UPI000ECB945F|nr:MULTISPECIES: hypothetical protein [unclassified Novosphingobium]HCF24921.1 hypothetical protein [Novosphingobium sp.]HQV03172.1 hypothetical protein [Novosphingobium sp.]
MAKRLTEKEAKQTYGVAAFHEVMDNGERRFRLRHASGSAYIRTEANATSGWQSSHYHREVRETYIVESGWMAFAELRGNQLELRIVEAGEVLTTNPGVIHNVFLPPQAVIHTVKHGAVGGDDRLTDRESGAFDVVTTALENEVAIRAAAIRPWRAASYPEEYRHFDTLVWQVPAWSTAIFAVSGGLVVEAAKGTSGDPLQQGAAGMLCLVALCLLVFAVVLSRFRTHQRALKAYSRTPVWKSAQSWTQAMIAVQYSILLGVGLNLLGVAKLSAALAGLSVGLLTFVWFERSIR